MATSLGPNSETLKEIRQKAESDPLASAGLCTNTCRFAQQHTYVYTHARTHEDGLIILKNWKKSNERSNESSLLSTVDAFAGLTETARAVSITMILRFCDFCINKYLQQNRAAPHLFDVTL